MSNLKPKIYIGSSQILLTFIVDLSNNKEFNTIKKIRKKKRKKEILYKMSSLEHFTNFIIFLFVILINQHTISFLLIN